MSSGTNGTTNGTTGAAFADRWNSLPKTDRIYIRRVVRHGMAFKPDEAELASMGHRWAAYQRTRLVQRLWLAWFLPAMLVGAATAWQLHPLAVGVVLAAGAQAAVVHRNLKRAAAKVV